MTAPMSAQSKLNYTRRVADSERSTKSVAVISPTRTSKLVPGRCATHLSTCGCAKRQGHVCANRLTDPCFAQPGADRRFIFLNSLANAFAIREPNVGSTVVSETAAVLLRFLSNKKWGRKNGPT